MNSHCGPTPPSIQPTTSRITAANRWDHFLARWGVNRGGHRVAPGLYALGRPTPDSPVFVTANYTLSFDALRQALAGIDGYILVLDTKGINVWCAAGKGTFGSAELVQRIEATRLVEVVHHRRLILPQLGAPDVAAHTRSKSAPASGSSTVPCAPTTCPSISRPARPRRRCGGCALPCATGWC